MNDFMNDPQSWQEKNARALTNAVAWLRMRLEKRAQGQSTPIVKSLAVEKSTGEKSTTAKTTDSLFTWPTDRTATQPQSDNPTPSKNGADMPHDQLSDDELVDAPPALEQLSQRFGLTRFEENVLLLCAALELDTRIAGLCAQAQHDPQRPYPTFALALSLFDEPAWDALVPERPLRYWRLLEISQPGATPLTVSPLRADERIVHYLKGANYLDDRLAALLVPLEIAGDPEDGLWELPPSHQQMVDTIVGHWQQPTAGAALPVAQLLGPDAASKHLVAQQAALHFGRQLCRLPADLLPANQAELETLVRLWQRESFLLPLALYLDAQELASGDLQLTQVQRFLARMDGLLVLGAREALPHSGRTSFAVEVSKPTAAEQRTAWQAALGLAGDQQARVLVSQFNLNLADIQRIAPLAAGLAAIHHTQDATEGDEDAEQAAHTQQLLWDLCCENERPRMDALAQRIEAKATWDDLVLPAAERQLLEQIAAQVRQRSAVYDEWGFRAKMNRGMGISALFAGSSGTGKTMAAEVIANDLRLQLYRIDLSAVVSKYIGETEKNLRRLFDAAEGGSAILFFDEADALFGKRSEVKDSHDRYANIEINYLLQRMEAYSGLAILATNMKSALDQAFMRRLRFVVNFPFPGVSERRRMWQRVFPQQMQQEHVAGAGMDYDKLARLNLTGGNIHNVALNAAFAAAHAGQPLTMQTIFDAARQELRKLEIPINEAEFR